MAGRLEGVGIATLLVSLGLIALSSAEARPGAVPDSAVSSGKTNTCEPNLAGPDYVGGVDVEGNRIAPADIDGGSGVDLSRISATPVLAPGRLSRRVQVVVQGVEPAKPPCERKPR